MSLKITPVYLEFLLGYRTYSFAYSTCLQPRQLCVGKSRAHLRIHSMSIQDIRGPTMQIEVGTLL